MDKTNERITQTILSHYPAAQINYLAQAKTEQWLAFSQCQVDLAELLGKDVDLLNTRQLSTVFQKEVMPSAAYLIAPMLMQLPNLKCSPYPPQNLHLPVIGAAFDPANHPSIAVARKGWLTLFPFWPR